MPYFNINPVLQLNWTADVNVIVCFTTSTQFKSQLSILVLRYNWHPSSALNSPICG